MKYCFGVDIGGTTVKLGIFEAEGKNIDKWRISARILAFGKTRIFIILS